MRDMTANTDKLTATVKLGDRDIEVYEPSENQVYVLAQVGRMNNGEAKTAFRGLGLFGNALDVLFVNDDDLDWAYQQLLTEQLSLETYIQLVPDILKAFAIDMPDEEEAPRRPAGRAQAVTKRPARRR